MSSTPLTSTKPLTGEVLVRKGIITPEQLAFCLEHQRQLRRIGREYRIGELIIKHGYAIKEEVDAAIGETMDLDAVVIPGEIRRRHGIYVHGIRGGSICVSAVEPLTSGRIQALLDDLNEAGIFVQSVRDVPMDSKEILRSIHSGKDIERENLLKNIAKVNEDPSNGQVLLQLLRGLFKDAIESRASDIYFQKVREETSNWVIYKVDGRQHYKYLLSPQAMASLAVRLRTEAQVDFEPRLPLDGRITFPYRDTEVDIRLATMPTSGGELITLRLLNPNSLKPLKALFEDYPDLYGYLKRILSFRQKTGGFLLFTGATESGKTTSLNGAIKEIDRRLLNVMTVEDPVEYAIPDARQTSVHEGIGLTFDRVLRSQLRHSPDVLVIGEMRDGITVEIALRSAESGHFVLSTLHTSRCKDALNRVVGMIPPEYKISGSFVLANYLNAVINQSLVPRLCSCALSLRVEEIKKGAPVMTNHEAQELWGRFARVLDHCGIHDGEMIHLARPRGCERCQGSGYRGRALVVEAVFFPADEPLRRQMEAQLLTADDYDVSGIMDLEKVEYHSLEMSIGILLRKGTIDPLTAYYALGLNRQTISKGY
ncbi:MAG: Flp pilus assembly complex ATPase component TadA [Alphaproteobacteria bacterium]|uniref:Flp pilus assembly complex ATPase component TadA n=1 Tax=Candidatus Nitrobium versatile TaxID=2884831 RepID=A0A953M3R1_9BACT|nr:Flp pilus assembly complex ATPase component TadA [Candidatus Nitrobium versatile]